MIENRLSECWETVIASLAHRIEYLEDELRWKSQRVDNLEKLNASLLKKVKRLEAAADNPNEDPFGGDGDE